MKKVLILNRRLFTKDVNVNHKYRVEYKQVYKNIPSYLKPFRSLWFILQLPFFKIWVQKFRPALFEGYDTIILHDASPTNHLNFFLNQIEVTAPSNTKLVFYYWNTVSSFEKMKFGKRWEVLSFDFNDAYKYRLRYVGGFFLPQSLPDKTLKTDLFFVGIDKGRFKRLLSLQLRLRDMGFNPLFLLVAPIKRFFSKKYTKSVPYRTVLTHIAETKCILDFSKSSQMGLTLRVYEALFYNKKLITNNSYIHKYIFYNKDHIYRLKNSLVNQEIGAFINGNKPSADEISAMKNIIDKYTFNAWLERVYNGETLDDVRL